MNAAIKWTLILSGIGIAGFVGYKMIKKRKEKKALESANQPTDNVISNNGAVYYGLSVDQTKKLQKKINTMLDLGKLSGFANIGRTVGSQLANTPIALSAINATSTSFVDTVNEINKTVITDVVAQAFQTFKNTVAAKLQEDGIYGQKTMAAVAALQIYLNTSKNAGLDVDGKYGPKTDNFTGWAICK